MCVQIRTMSSKDLQIFCLFKTQSCFAALKRCWFFVSWLPAALPVQLQRGFDFWFCHSNIDSIFQFYFSWCFCGTFGCIYKLGWQVAEITEAIFAHIITPITCAIIWTMCAGGKFKLSWPSEGVFLHKQFWKHKLSNKAYFCG